MSTETATVKTTRTACWRVIHVDFDLTVIASSVNAEVLIKTKKRKNDLKTTFGGQKTNLDKSISGKDLL